MEENTIVESIPEYFATLEEAGDFWDTHDAGNYEAFLRPVDTPLTVAEHLPQSVLLEHSLSNKLRHVARNRGVSLETLVNLWLNEKLLLTEPS